MSTESGVVIGGIIRSTGINAKGKPTIQIEVPSGMGNVELQKITVLSNGQKIGDHFQGKVALNVFDGKFYGFRQV